MNMHNTYIPCGTRHNSRGFSLVELMVALVITLILLAGIGQIFLSSKKSYAIQDTLGRMQENGRYAMDVLKADLRRAGYWGGNADISTIQGSLGINDTTTEACTTTGPSAWARMLNRGIYGLNLSGTEKPSTSSYACIRDSGASPYLRGDVLAVRYADPAEVGGITTPLASGQTIADAYPNQIFLRSSLFRGRIFEGTDSESASNDLDAPAVRTSLLVARAYYIGASSNTSRCPNQWWLRLRGSGLWRGQPAAGIRHRLGRQWLCRSLLRRRCTEHQPVYYAKLGPGHYGTDMDADPLRMPGNRLHQQQHL
jgi:prepilin-type N-terminal cleavage/methylation domain-containing protein